MTESESIKKHIDECNHRIENISFFMDSNSDANKEECCNNIEILQKVINALEKQIPKKPKTNRTDSETIYCKCPSCNLVTVLYRNCIMNYCKECGQRLDWSDEE